MNTINPETVDYTTLSGPDLVRAFNALALIATDLGTDRAPTPVQRFGDLEAGRRRFEALLSMVRARRASEAAVTSEGPAAPSDPGNVDQAAVTSEDSTVAKPKKSATKHVRTKVTGTTRKGGGETLLQQMERYNDRVREALKLGVPKVRVHTSTFESHDKGVAQFHKLEARIKAHASEKKARKTG